MTPKELRKKRGKLTQTQFGELIGRKLRMIQYYESGEKPIPHVVKLAVILMDERRSGK